MKHIVFLFFVLASPITAASPMLAAGGAALTNVNVTGYGLYDVFFEDGVVQDFFGGTSFDDAREMEANAVSAAVVAVLRDLEVLPTQINGCDATLTCFLFNPDTFTKESGFADFSFAMGYVSGNPVWFTENPRRVIYSAELFADDSTLALAATLVRYAPSVTGNVPIPTTVALLALGLFACRFSYRARQRL